MRERIGTIKAHYYSGHIRTCELGRCTDVLESESESVIAGLPELPTGSFYAFHAERMARPDELAQATA